MGKKHEKISATKVGLGVMTCGVSLLFTGIKKTKKHAPARPSAQSDNEARWYAMLNDKTFNNLCNSFYRLCEEIEEDYSIIYNMKVADPQQLDAFDRKCVEAMASVEILIPYWEKYGQPLPTMCEPIKRMAMVRERRGLYEDAALACVQAIRLGMPDDGTKHGMRGRLAKIVKAGNLEPNAEVKRILSIM